MARKPKKSGSTTILLTLILLVVMSYAGFKLFDFIQKNNLSPININPNVKIPKYTPEKNKTTDSANAPINKETPPQNTETQIVYKSPKIDTETTLKLDADMIEKPKNAKNNGTFSMYYITLNSNDDFIQQKISLSIDYTDSPIFAVISKLVSYTPDKPYYNFIPKGTKLKGAWIKNSILYLNFSKEFLNNQNGYSAIEAQIQQITNTAFQFKNISGIKIQIEGQNVKYFSDEGFLLDIVFKRT